MIKLPADLQFQKVPRVVVYAVLATGITAALFAADAAYRWAHDARTQVAAPLTGARTVETPKPAPVEATVSASPARVVTEAPERNIVDIKGPVTLQSVTAQAPSPPDGSVPAIASDPVLDPAVGTMPRGSTSNIASGAVPEVASGPADAAPRLAQPSPQLKQQQTRRPPAKQATRERAAPRRPVQAAAKPSARTAKPDVYWERDGGSQLGFAPQLRKRTCNPATGQMPMQCYYPREGREKFPAKPLN